jgi:hypothetical protein
MFKPDITGPSSKSGAKVRLFFELCKYFAEKSPKISISVLFTPDLFGYFKTIS